MPLIERSNVVDADASVVPKLCRSEGDDGVLASVAEAMLKLARHARLSSLCRVVPAISSQVNLSRDVYIYISTPTPRLEAKASSELKSNALEKRCEQPKYARCPYRARPSRGPYPARTTRSPPAREVLTPEQLSACASVPCTARPSPTRVPFLLLCSTLICEHSLLGFLFSPPRPPGGPSSRRSYPPRLLLLLAATGSSASLRPARATALFLLLADSGAPSLSQPLPPACP